MSILAENTAPSENTVDSVVDLDPGSPGEHVEPPVVVSQPKIPMALLRPDPKNPREELDLNPSFCKSVKKGVLVALVIRAHPDEPGMWMVVEGHRRYYAALDAGLTHVPYSLLEDAEDGDQYVTMLVTNHPSHRVNHNPYEQIRAIDLAYKARDSGRTGRQGFSSC